MSFKKGQGTKGGVVSGSHDVCSPDLKDKPKEKELFIKILDRNIEDYENKIIERSEA